jgi:2-methylisocitrate lyase-like PEP mutase family enzyme
MKKYGTLLRERVQSKKILPLIGVYDAFSASIAASHYEALFLSGYGFAASKYGLPDEGYIAWPDIVVYTEQIRAILPDTHLIVDIDEGYGDPNIAASVVKRLERVGASAVILEDQRRPKRCGHLPGKEILPTDEYLDRLNQVLKSRSDLFVIARTDATNIEEGIQRAKLYRDAGADAIMIEGLASLDDINLIREEVGDSFNHVVNLIAGGKTPPVTLTKLSELRVNLVIYSTPCLYAAQKAVQNAMIDLKRNDGCLELKDGDVNLNENLLLMKKNAKNAI